MMHKTISAHIISLCFIRRLTHCSFSHSPLSSASMRCSLPAYWQRVWNWKVNRLCTFSRDAMRCFARGGLPLYSCDIFLYTRELGNTPERVVEQRHMLIALPPVIGKRASILFQLDAGFTKRFLERGGLVIEAHTVCQVDQ